MRKVTALLQFVLLLFAWSFSSSAWSAGYPDKPVRIVVPYPSGGGADILARAFGQKLGVRWGQPVIVDNRAGAGGSIGTEFVARTPPDGYTLLMASPSHAINAGLYKNLAFDPSRNFAPIVLAGSGPLVLVVNASFGANSVKEFIEMARAHPDKINYASAGVGSSPHLAGELFKTMAHVKMVHIAYKGASPALTDLMSGQVQAMFAPVPTVIELLKSGKLKALGVTTPTVFQALPNIPPVSNDIPGFEVLQWYAFLAPAGTPSDVVAKLYHDIVEVLNEPDMKERFSLLGADPGGQSPAEVDKLVRDEVVKWTGVIKAANIQAE
jgi:tripartite-type tricarboxylate transporter receptor subunit TctC